MFSCQFYLLFLIKYLQTMLPCALASWGSSLKETINFLLYSIGWLDALWGKNWYENTEMKTAIFCQALQPVTTCCFHSSTGFIHLSEAILVSESYQRSTQTVKQCSGAQELAFLAVFFLYPCSQHQRSAFYCSLEALSAPAMASSCCKT